jgi:protein-disulfide isomerase
MRAIFTVVIFFGLTQMASSQDISDEKIKQLALEAILENPEIIMQAVSILRQRDAEIAASGANTVRLELENDPGSPNLGNPEGDVTVVEFFDYNCPYCRQAGKTVQELIGSDPNVRIIFQEWPVLGEGSMFAARAALASRAQGKYEEFHWTLMNGEGRATEASILKVARDLGLDIVRLLADMKSPAVEVHLERSNDLARSLGFTGTPAFIVGDQTVPGMISLEKIEKLIAGVRAAE